MATSASLTVSGSPSPGRATTEPRYPSAGGQDASRTRSEPTRSHTSAPAAPTPSATIRAIRGSNSSVATACAIPPENRDSTSYGVARRPYTNRFANRCTRSRTGWNATATNAVARIDNPKLRSDPTTRPTPTTIATYTDVMNPAITPYTSVLLITQSMSYRRYRRTAKPIETGMSRKDMTETV